MVVLSKKHAESPKTPPNKPGSRRSAGGRTNFIPINSPESQDATVITLPGNNLHNIKSL